jgi:acetyltransferase EpsM
MADRQNLLIVGAGGHGQVVADILLTVEIRGGDLHPLGFLDDDVRLAGQTPLGLPVLGTIAQAQVIDHDAIVVAIGNNVVRRDIYLRLAAAGERIVGAVHPSATIGRDVAIGPGTVVCAGAVVNPGCRVGSNVILNSGCIVEHHCRIADHAHIAPGACLGGEAAVGEGALVGIGAVILPGIQVGEGSVVGAGAVVTRSVAGRVVAVGAPARAIRSI